MPRFMNRLRTFGTLATCCLLAAAAMVTSGTLFAQTTKLYGEVKAVKLSKTADAIRKTHTTGVSAVKSVETGDAQPAADPQFNIKANEPAAADASQPVVPGEGRP